MQLRSDLNLNEIIHIGFFTIPMHNMSYLVGNIFFCILYKCKFQIFERERSRGHPDEQWPWESMKPDEWNKLFWRSIKFNLLNSWFSNVVVYLSVTMSGIPSENLTAIDKMPTPTVFAAQILFCMMIEDATFYISHRTLHLPWLYPSVHKIHHEHKVTFSLAALHAHPLEYILGNVVPVMVGPAILGPRMHLASAFGWYFMRQFESIEGHSGYSFSWSPFRLLPC